MSEDRDKLIAALQRVPDGATLMKNAVGNLSVLVPLTDDPEYDNAYIGYLDLQMMELDLFEDDDE